MSVDVRLQEPGNPTSCQLIGVNEVAEMLGCSARSVYRLADAGRIPPPVKLNSLVRWSRTAVDDWIRGGCPSIRKGQ